MNKILLIISLFVFTACNKQEQQQVNKEFYFSPEKSESTDRVCYQLTPSGEYVNLQIKMHTAYRLLKALNDGAISQEEYEKLKAELI